MNPDRALITACVIARDEAENLGELLPTLRWADEILALIDDRTTDDSAAVATALADRVEVRPFVSFPAFRNLGLDLARFPWVLFVDADERVSPELIAEIKQATAAAASPDAAAGHWIPRHNIIFGRLVRGGGWAPDYQLRLLNRQLARYDERRLVHEIVHLDGPAGHLSERLLHFNYASPREFVDRQAYYTALEAESLRSEGVTFRARSLVGQPLRELWRRYVVLGGWQDGPVGLFLCLVLAYYAFKRVRLVQSSVTRLAA